MLLSTLDNPRTVHYVRGGPPNSPSYNVRPFKAGRCHKKLGSRYVGEVCTVAEKLAFADDPKSPPIPETSFDSAGGGAILMAMSPVREMPMVTMKYQSAHRGGTSI
jgi:hypothetical protein